MMPTARSRLLLSYLLVVTPAPAILGCREAEPKPPNGTSVRQSDGANAFSGGAAKRESIDPDRSRLQVVRTLIAEQQWEQAQQHILNELLLNPQSVAWLTVAAELAISQQNPERVFEYYELMSTADRNRPAVQQLIVSAVQADPRLSKPYFEIVWRAMEVVLAAEAERDTLRYALVDLIAQQGYRHRACQHIDVLIARGTARRQDLEMVSDRRGVWDFIWADEAPEESGSALASAANALEQGVYRRGLELLDNTHVQAGERTHPEVAALYGRLLAAAQDYDAMLHWLSWCPDSAESYADYWTAMGMALLHADEKQPAAAAFLTAIEIDPTSRLDYHLLGTCLAGLQGGEMATTVYNRGQEVEGVKSLVAKLRSQPDAEFLMEALAKRLVQLGRPLEALQWQILILRDRSQSDAATSDSQAANGLTASTQALARLTGQRRHLIARADYIPAMREYARFGMMEDAFPKPSREAIVETLGRQERQTVETQDRDPHIDAKNGTAASAADSAAIAMHNVADEVGLDFHYLNRTPVALQQIRSHESLGGGIGVVDFDQDGRQDIFLAQGSGDPPAQPGNASDELYRCVGDRWSNVTVPAGCTDDAYSHGVAVGDLNQDGWPDLVVGNLGVNRLMINNGDGTFSDASHLFQAVQGRFTTSLGIGDIDADGLPDIVEANYLDDPRIFDTLPPPLNGVPVLVSPNSFRAARDRWWRNLGNGAFEPADLETGQEWPRNSLGILMADILPKSPGIEIFVGNDLGPNRLWTQTSEPAKFGNQASVLGVALNGSGLATASMGIAAGDYDLDGKMDLHVSNFSGEPSSLFIQNEAGTFSDQSATFDLDRWTLPMVGFGSQAIDVELDGHLDLAILNGHIEDLAAIDKGFRMPPQLLMKQGSQRAFAPARMEDPSGYWTRPALGRSLVTIDWNNDGRLDLIANHLDQPMALLENRTEVAGSWLTVRLIATAGARDAVGAIVRVVAGENPAAPTMTRWKSGADGYLCRNDERLHFGLGQSADKVDLSVEWPGGEAQQFRQLPVNAEYLLIQGDQPWPMQ